MKGCLFLRRKWNHVEAAGAINVIVISPSQIICPSVLSNVESSWVFLSFPIRTVSAAVGKQVMSLTRINKPSVFGLAACSFCNWPLKGAVRAKRCFPLGDSCTNGWRTDFNKLHRSLRGIIAFPEVNIQPSLVSMSCGTRTHHTVLQQPDPSVVYNYNSGFQEVMIRDL